ncbi:hypothetical protein [Rhizobium rhizophilum]|uniref:hypothetical protein n=1 Tax=Rhizobium rhizophilum TaxID=1850373 RepID=UPI0019821864
MGKEKMLPVKCCNQLASKQVFEGYDAGFRKAERLFERLGDGNRREFAISKARLPRPIVTGSLRKRVALL